MDREPLFQEVRAALAAPGDARSRSRAAVEAIVRAFGALSATFHRAEPKTRMLHLVAQRGVPEKVLAVVSDIPFGKGMAGICILRGEPVTVCNLQTDTSGVAKPGAKETLVAGALVVPVRSRAGGEILGTLGVGKPAEHTYTAEETAALEGCAAILAGGLQSEGPLAAGPASGPASR